MILHKDKIKVTDFMPMFFSNNDIALFAFTNLTPDYFFIDVIIAIFKLFARLTLTPIIRKPCHPLRSPGIESDIFFENSSGILCGILSGILPGIYSDNVL